MRSFTRQRLLLPLLCGGLLIRSISVPERWFARRMYRWSSSGTWSIALRVNPSKSACLTRSFLRHMCSTSCIRISLRPRASRIC
ncbi:hypothetical protein BJY04DRAFT_200777 [Aspergillus karnatakaensis]|uniref:uncharacterized protein n=1 Tax=Aspergillus karnatakaensis TaxID=1810916 RepID=UPI003CCD5108